MQEPLPNPPKEDAINSRERSSGEIPLFVPIVRDERVRMLKERDLFPTRMISLGFKS